MCARKRITIDPNISLDDKKRKAIDSFHSDPKVRDYQRSFVNMSQAITQMVNDYKDEIAFRDKKKSDKMNLDQELAELNRQEMINVQELERVHWMKSMNKAHTFLTQEKLAWAESLEKRVAQENAAIAKRKAQLMSALGDKKKQVPIEF